MLFLESFLKMNSWCLRLKESKTEDKFKNN